MQSEAAPKALGTYSQAIVTNGMVYCSGQATWLLDHGTRAPVISMQAVW